MQKLTENEMYAIFEKLSSLVLTSELLIGHIPDNQFQHKMKMQFNNTLSHITRFCNVLRKDYYEVDTRRDFTIPNKAEFIGQSLDYILNIASTGDPLTYGSFTNTLKLETNRHMRRYTEEINPGCEFVQSEKTKVVPAA